jgi:hypothetical protein
LMFKECKHVNTDAIRLDDPIPELSYVDYKKPEDKALIEHHYKILHGFPNLLNPGRVIFAPGNMTRKSHECVSKFWTQHGCAVFIFNGERTQDGFYGKLTLPDKTVIDIPHMFRYELVSNEMQEYFENYKESLKLQAQLNEIISDFYIQNQLKNYTVVMTGLLCVSRAQTLVHPVWGTFTDGIYFKATDPDDAYQQQRQQGHIKNWPTYRGAPRIFMPEDMRRDILILEKRADSFAERQKGHHATLDDYINTTPNEKTSKEKRKDKKDERTKTRESIVICDKPEQALKSIADVNKFLSEKLKRKVACREFYKVEEYYITTRLLSYYKKDKAEELTSNDRLTEEKFKRLNKTQNISNKKGQSYMVYPVYPTMLSSPDEVQYYVSYLPPT